MKCPRCKKRNTRVLDTRQRDGTSVQRRRRCLDCEFRFNATETIAEPRPRAEDCSCGSPRWEELKGTVWVCGNCGAIAHYSQRPEVRA